MIVLRVLASPALILPCSTSLSTWLRALRRMASILAKLPLMPETEVVRAGIVVERVVSITVTLTVAACPPFAVVALIVAVPALLAVILPDELTEATALLLLDQLTVLLAVLGAMLVFTVRLSFWPSITSLTDKLSEVGTLGSTTLMVNAFLTEVLRFELAVMVTLPTFLAVTKPLELTVATEVLLLFHVSCWLAEEGDTLPLSWSVFLRDRVLVLGLTVIELGAANFLTVTVMVFFTPLLPDE